MSRPNPVRLLLEQIAVRTPDDQPVASRLPDLEEEAITGRDRGVLPDPDDTGPGVGDAAQPDPEDAVRAGVVLVDGPPSSQGSLRPTSGADGPPVALVGRARGDDPLLARGEGRRDREAGAHEGGENGEKQTANERGGPHGSGLRAMDYDKVVLPIFPP